MKRSAAPADLVRHAGEAALLPDGGHRARLALARWLPLLLFALPAAAQSLVVASPLTINAGSATDQYFTGGKAWTMPAAAAPFPTLRFGASFSYDVSVVPGLYSIALVMVEPNALANGQRLFTVTINGQETGPIDVFSLVHADNVSTVFMGYALAGVGAIHLQFTGKTGNAIVSQIVISKVEFTSIISCTCPPPLL
jgi:hypothetical protein